MTTFADPDSATVAGPKPPPTVLRGPQHADNYRIKVGRFKERWYRDPLPGDAIAPAVTDDDEAYPSVSSVKGASGKDWSFVSLKRIAHADDLSEIAAKGFYERYERFKVINQLDLTAAMRRGTNVHTWAECIAYGIPQYLRRDGEGGAYFPVVDKLFQDLQPKLVAAEFVCIHRTLNGLGYGGTSDGIFEIDGKLYMVDWKSRSEDADHDVYPEEAGQIGAYCGAEYIIVEDKDPANPHGARRDTMPELDGGLIVSIKPDSYEVYPIDLPRATEHFHSQHAWWVARRSEGRTYGPKWAPRRATTLIEQLAESIDHVRREKLYKRHDAMTKAQQAEFRERVVAIDTDDLDAVEALIEDIEHPPKLIDMAKRRMASDQAREVDRRLSDEGGAADPDDAKVFEAAWELGLNATGKRWLGKVVNEAVEGKADFRLSVLGSQRRADIYCALTTWGTTDEFDARNDECLRAAVFTVTGVLDARPLGAVVGSLTTEQAAALRKLVIQIAAGQATYLIDPDGTAAWQVRPTPSES